MCYSVLIVVPSQSLNSSALSVPFVFKIIIPGMYKQPTFEWIHFHNIHIIAHPIPYWCDRYNIHYIGRGFNEIGTETSAVETWGIPRYIEWFSMSMVENFTPTGTTEIIENYWKCLNKNEVHSIIGESKYAIFVSISSPCIEQFKTQPILTALMSQNVLNAFKCSRVFQKCVRLILNFSVRTCHSVRGSSTFFHAICWLLSQSMRIIYHHVTQRAS